MEITKKDLIRYQERKFPKNINFHPIGVIHSPFTNLKGIPIQPSFSDAKGKIEIFKQYQAGLKDLEGFSHVICLYFFDLVKMPVPLQSKPFLTDEIKGVFGTRTPFRPNPIGLSILEIINIHTTIINVNNLDILDKTPVIDIKPYVPRFDHRETDKIGWLRENIRKKIS